MRRVIDPGKERRSINFIDDIPYSEVRDLSGRPLTLRLSLMLQNGNSEMRLATGRDDEVSCGPQPVLVWFNGAGWRGADKNLMAAELMYYAEAGCAVACVYYRSSAEGHFPAQLTDCRTAVRFLRAHAAEYGLDPERVAVMGRSAGGFLAAWMAMNAEGDDTAEWAGFSSRVTAAVDLFGPVDLEKLQIEELERMKDPAYRWHRMEETHAAALLGGDMDTLIARCRSASPIHAIGPGMAPILIVHGEQDPVVPVGISEDFYERIVRAGLEERAELVIVKNGGHGTRELFQPATKQVVREFLDRTMPGKREG